MDTARILIVEDDAAARMLLSEILGDVGYTAIAVASVGAALQRLEAANAAGEPFDLLLVDIYLGDGSGLDVLVEAQNQPQPPLVVLLTGAGSLETAVEALRHGAADYLLKPTQPETLRQAVARVLERRDAPHVGANGHGSPREVAVNSGDDAARRDRSLHVGPLTLDTDRHAALWNDHTLPVTPIEYALLRFLAETPGRVRGYGEIVAWTHGHHLDEGEAKQLIKSHVRNLRRKIGLDYLAHVRGAGYMLLAEPRSNGTSDDED